MIAGDVELKEGGLPVLLYPGAESRLWGMGGFVMDIYVRSGQADLKIEGGNIVIEPKNDHLVLSQS